MVIWNKDFENKNPHEQKSKYVIHKSKTRGLNQSKNQVSMVEIGKIAEGTCWPCEYSYLTAVEAEWLEFIR